MNSTQSALSSQQRQQQIVKIANAGIVGAGGGGFPAYAKFQWSEWSGESSEGRIETVVANGSECEPLLEHDKFVLIRYAQLIVEGLELSMKIAGAKVGILAVKGHYPQVVNALEAVLAVRRSEALYSDSFRVKLHLLDNYYPAGDEFLLVYETTGKIIPEGGLPLQVGVIVHNVLTLLQMKEGDPVVNRFVTIAGEVKEKKILKLPIGTTLESILEKIELNRPLEELRIIDGGPMMGNLLPLSASGCSEFSVGKRSSALIFLPADHHLVVAKELPLDLILKRSKSVCCQCYRCSELCPRALLGHTISPHKTMRTVDYNLSSPIESITSSFLCSQCGLCELYACDLMGLSPKKVLFSYRNLLRKQGVENPHCVRPVTVSSEWKHRRVPSTILIRKLGLEKYASASVHASACADCVIVAPYEIKRVFIKINEHLGMAALPVVKYGDKVRVGDIVAKGQFFPENPQQEIASVYHASINGTVSEVTQARVVIIAASGDCSANYSKEERGNVNV